MTTANEVLSLGISLLFFPTVGDEYLSQDVAHIEPLSSRIFTGVSYAGTAISRSASETAWHGRVGRVFADVLAGSGYLLNYFVATAEAVGALASGLLLNVLHIATACRFECLQKHTVKAAGYCLNALGILATQIAFVCSGIFNPGNYTVPCAVRHVLHLLTAVVSQFALGGLFMAISGEGKGEYIPLRALRVLIENGQEAISSIVSALQSDFGIPFSDLFTQALASGQVIQQFLQRYPGHQSVMQDASWDNLQNAFTDFVAFSGLNGEAGEFVLQTYNPQEKAYQQQLKQYVKTAFSTINGDETLASYLSESGSAEEGREALTGFYAEMYCPVAHYAELLELEAAQITCLEQFANHKLQESHASRYANIAAARELLAALPAEEKPLLIKKLLQVGSFTFPDSVSEEAEGRITTLFHKIGALAAGLYQGKLMTEEVINIRSMEVSARNLFQQACQEAV
ncbi:MAG: hypothetical protein JSR46_06950 [Verrucomicrobia bacterium]|nr:hypothetical protein [Verrucomicrobiota bacterium]